MAAPFLTFRVDDTDLGRIRARLRGVRRGVVERTREELKERLDDLISDLRERTPGKGRVARGWKGSVTSRELAAGTRTFTIEISNRSALIQAKPFILTSVWEGLSNREYDIVPRRANGLLRFIGKEGEAVYTNYVRWKAKMRPPKLLSFAERRMDRDLPAVASIVLRDMARRIRGR